MFTTSATRRRPPAAARSRCGRLVVVVVGTSGEAEVQQRQYLPCRADFQIEPVHAHGAVRVLFRHPRM
jgi:hypothetical protein